MEGCRYFVYFVRNILSRNGDFVLEGETETIILIHSSVSGTLRFEAAFIFFGRQRGKYSISR